MRFATFLLLVISFFTAPALASSNDVELENSNLILKLHFDQTPRNGQMVGAYLASIKPKAGKNVSKITLLLNPGLQFVKADAGKKRLNATASMKPVKGMDMLELNVVEIDLGKTLSGKARLYGKSAMDIAIHFRGYLEDIAWTGLSGIKETLNPNFAMIRAESFGYPVFAEPSIDAIKTAWAHKPFHQSASIEYPGANAAVSNLIVESKQLNGHKTVAELSTKAPARLLSVAIGPYSIHTNGAVSVSYLSGNSDKAGRVSNLFSAEVNTLEKLLGTIDGTSINIIEMPTGYTSNAPSDAIFADSGFFDAPVLSASHKSRIFNLWKFNKAGREGHWGAGLDAVIVAAVTAPNMMAEAQKLQFSNAAKLFAGNAKLGKTSLADYIVDGFAAKSDVVSSLAFLVLYELLGQEDFFATVRGLRRTLGNGYADMEAVTEYLQDTLKNKKAKKFAKNWFSKGKAGKDMAKAKSFGELVQRYK